MQKDCVGHDLWGRQRLRTWLGGGKRGVRKRVFSNGCE